MAKTKRHPNKKHTKRRTRHRRRSSKRQRGGYSHPNNVASSSASFSAPNNGGGAAGWVEGKYGNVDQQYNSVFDIGSKTLGNTFTTLPASQVPTSQQLSLVQSAGGRRRRGRKCKGTKKRGGFLGPVVNQAIVPFSLLALQNKFGRRKSKRNYKFTRRSK